jgi:mono/diheme cytochrome c family protein
MEKIVKFVVLPLAVVLLLAVVGIGFSVGWATFLGPRTRPTSDRKFTVTPQRMARGEYLVMGECACVDCHSPRDLAEPGAPPKEGMLGAGKKFPEDQGVVAIASNITPDKATGIGAWTDDEIARAIREGVDKDGRALYPMMPYQLFRRLSDEDVASIVVFLRSLPPIPNELPKTDPGFPLRYIFRNVPQPLTEPVVDHFANSVDRGRHLAIVSGCGECHTPHDEQHQALPGLEFAGGDVFRELSTPAVSANLTPDASGIGGFTREQFRQTVRTGNNGARQLNPVMPSVFYARMTDEDLDAIYDYLHTLQPVKHWVSSTGKAALCPVCNHEHALAEMNMTAAK